MTGLGDLLDAKCKKGKVIKNDSQVSGISSSVDDHVFTGIRLSEKYSTFRKKFIGPTGSINTCQFTEDVKTKATHMDNILVSVGKSIFNFII